VATWYKNKTGAVWLGALLWFLPIAPALATTVSYTVNNLGGTNWEYNYSVSNDTLTTDIEEFTVFFDVALYQNLALVAAPSGWDPLVIQPDLSLPDDGFYDALALSGGITPTNSLGGFRLSFDYLGTGTPGSQAFDIVDPVTFAMLDSGFTQAAAVPVPAAGDLFLGGITLLMSLLTRRRATE